MKSTAINEWRVNFRIKSASKRLLLEKIDSGFASRETKKSRGEARRGIWTPVTTNSFPAILQFLEFTVKVSLRGRHESVFRM